MITILDELLVNSIRFDSVRAEATREQLDEVVLELRREVSNVLASLLANDEHLSKVRLGLGVALEAVLVPALFLADLAVPAQPLEALGLHLVGKVLRRTD